MSKWCDANLVEYPLKFSIAEILFVVKNEVMSVLDDVNQQVNLSALWQIQ